MDKEYRPRLSAEEYQVVKDFKTKHKALEDECKSLNIPIEDVKHYWHKSEHFSMFVGNKGNKPTFTDLSNGLISEIKAYSPKYPEIKREPLTDAHALVIDPADIHIGKLSTKYETGDEYNSAIAVHRVKTGVDGLIAKASPYNIEKVILIIGNDVLHTDNTKRTTTSGTPQDTDGMWYEAFLLAKQMYVEVIETLLQLADVEVVFNPSNHDYTTGFFLAQTIEAWFNQCKQVSFNVDISHRKYTIYGKNLIGTTHGDGAKTNDLPLLMAHEAAQYWAYCVHRYFYTKHLHHKVSKDYMSVCVETTRSPSGTDSWHSKNGFQHAPKALEGFLHHPNHGQVARFTHLF